VKAIKGSREFCEKQSYTTKNAKGFLVIQSGWFLLVSPDKPFGWVRSLSCDRHTRTSPRIALALLFQLESLLSFSYNHHGSWLFVAAAATRQDNKTIENTQRKTCKAIWGKINDTSATQGADSHHEGDKPLVEPAPSKKNCPATSQIKVELIGILAS